MLEFKKNIEDQVKQLTILVGELRKELKEVKMLVDEHLLEHMIEDRNRQFELDYLVEED